MKDFISSTKLNPCPVCNRTKDRDCRQKPDGLMVLCHSYIDVDPQVTGWKWLKTTKDVLEWGVFVRQEKPDKRPASGREERSVYMYKDRDGQPQVKVDKVRSPDGRKDFYQSRWECGQWVTGGHLEPARVMPYRIDNIQTAIDQGELIWVVEGEECANFLWKLGMPATCLLKAAIGHYEANAADRLGLGEGKFIICPDKDKPGVEYADKVVEILGKERIAGWYYCFDNSLWEHLGKGGGADVEDEICEKKLKVADLVAGIVADRKSLQPDRPIAPPKIELSGDGIIAEVDALIESGVHNGRLRGEIACLAAKYKIGVNAIWDIYRERLSDAEFDDDRADLQRSINDLLAADRRNLDLSKVLPKQIAGAIAAEAALMGVRPETYFLSILTSVSAAQNSKTRISICPALGWSEPPNLYAAIVAESSQRKTPILKATVYKPFQSLKSASDAQFEIESQLYARESDRYNAMKPTDRYNEGIDRPKAPTRKLHVVSDISTEGLVNQGIAHPEKTLLYLRDELAGVFGDLNKYRGGRGSDRQLLLEAFNGASIDSVRASKDARSHNNLLLSIFGGIQPQVLSKIMGDGGDADGLWGRFLFCIQPTTAAPSLPPHGAPRVADLPAMLGGIYERIDNLAPVKYALSPTAYDLFSRYRDRLEAMRVDKQNCSLLRHFVGKLQGITARIALNLHCFWGVAKGECVTSDIDGDTMARAIDVAQFALAQIQILAAEVEQTTGESGKVHKLLQLLKERSSASVREVQRRITRGVADTARLLIDRAAQMGFVRWVDRKTVELVATPQTTADIPQPQPPVVDRPVTTAKIEKIEVITPDPEVTPTASEFINHDDWIEYKLSADGETIEIELAFYDAGIAKAWQRQLTALGGNVRRPHKVSRDRIYTLLVVKNLPVRFLSWILESNLCQTPQLPTRRR